MRAKSIALLQVDAFTDEAFAGNPAAVCLLDAARDATWMHAVAREMNLPETAFVSPASTDDGGFDLRWFTPTIEVDLCGHATLAAARSPWSKRLALDATARFHTKSGVLTASRTGDWIELDFPATKDEPADAPPGLADALGVTPVYVGRSRFDYLVEVDRESVVREMTPDMALAFARCRSEASSSPAGPRPRGGISSRAFSLLRRASTRIRSPDRRIVASRRSGVRIWVKNRWSGARCPRARGTVRVRLDGDRVKLGGQAVSVLRGELLA